jgi:alpha-1,2-mannosyltransferase
MKLVWQAAAVLVLVLQLPAFVTSLLVLTPEPIDFIQEWASARNWWLSQPVYADQRESLPRLMALPEVPAGQELEWYIIYNAHPPAAVLLALPLGLLSDPWLASALWNVLSTALLVVAGAILWLEWRPQLSPWLWLPVAAGLMLYNPFRQQVNQGQLNGVLLMLLTLAWRAWRRNRSVSAGVWLAMATLVKLFPGFLFLLLLARRQWRGLFAGAVTGLGLAALGVLVLGWEAHLDYVEKVLPSVQAFRCGKLNASLPGLWAKLFVGSAFEKVEPWIQWPGLAWSLTVVSGIGLAWLVVWQARRADSDQSFGVALVCMTLASPITWDHSLLLLTQPLLWLGKNFAAGWRRWALVLILVVFGFHHHALWRVGAEQGWLPHVFGVGLTLTLASLLCWAQLALLGLLYWTAPRPFNPPDITSARPAAADFRQAADIGRH